MKYCYGLAKIYRQGDSAKQNDKKAKFFYNKACESGNLKP